MLRKKQWNKINLKIIPLFSYHTNAIQQHVPLVQPLKDIQTPTSYHHLLRKHPLWINCCCFFIIIIITTVCYLVFCFFAYFPEVYSKHTIQSHPVREKEESDNIISLLKLFWWVHCSSILIWKFFLWLHVTIYFGPWLTF